MLFLPIYMLLTSISFIVTLTSSLVPFGLSICQHTPTLSSTVSNGHLSLHHGDFIEACLAHNNLVQLCLTTVAAASRPFWAQYSLIQHYFGTAVI